ncbi:MAG TPA: hypothetical protein PKW55_01670 [Spirochaetota bacterium]|mgnify:CR=1 FL=1|nr:hypothetical protein [Spirochaetota bacterium]HOM38997.1 hypothetical protein [Spirochaetota bacterium]HPQ48344.1 hypothetical protein [Spirochaetota bacterium]
MGNKRCLVLIKEVPGEDDIKIDENSWTIKRGIGVINIYDYVAIDLALELKKEGYLIEVLTMGPLTSKRIIRFCLSLGFDKGYIVTDPIFAGSDTLATSTVLAESIKYIGVPDIILTGNHSFDGGTGHVPLQIGQILGINSFSNVNSLNIKDNDLAEIITELDEKYIIESSFPFILSLSLKEISIKLPRARDYFSDYQITEIDNSRLNVNPLIVGLNGSPTKVVNIKPYISNRIKNINYFTKKEIKTLSDYIKRGISPFTFTLIIEALLVFFG